MLTSIVILFILVIVNGIFAMVELAVFSAKRPLLSLRAENGDRGAKAALHLTQHPGPFLSTTQTGITLIAIISGAFGGATLEEPVAEWLGRFEPLADYAGHLSLVLVVSAISYFSLVIGELVPKQLALKRAEAIACVFSRPMLLIAQGVRPLILLLDASNRVVLRLLGLHEQETAQVTQEEVKAVIAEGTESGALDSQEQSMIESVLRLDQLSVKRVMTPRGDVVSIDIGENLSAVARKIAESHHSRYVLVDGDFDHIVGVVTAKDILARMEECELPKLLDVAISPIMLPDTASVGGALEHFKKSTANIALIVDEYGGFEGIITFKDILEAIVGHLPEGENYTAPVATQREDGSWLIDGLMALHEVEDTLKLSKMETEGAGYHTLAGFVMHHLQHIPTEGEHFTWEGARFEVVDMDGHRIDKLLVALPEAAEE